MDKMNNSVHEIDDFSAFIKYISEKLRCAHWVFRGVQNSDYTLVPSLGRNVIDCEEELFRQEMRMIRSSFGNYTDQDGGKNSDLNQLLLAQHHGAPTRLLDWTSSALVAAYFASQDHDDHDFAIYASHVCPQSAVETHFNAHDFSTVDFYKGYIGRQCVHNVAERNSHQSLRLELDERGIIFITGSNISPRVAAQQGLVSIQKNIKIAFNEHESDCVTKCIKIVVDKRQRKPFQDVLFQLGVRKRALFPDQDALFSSHHFEESIRTRLMHDCNNGD